MMLLLSVLLVGLNWASAAKLGVVQTEGGLVEGNSFSMGLFRTVEVFKGVPFADVPGKWEKPKPHPGWSGILKATKYRDHCLQVTLLQTKTRGSEDCLYLNIFIPHGLSVSTNLPVMVYLFGGAFLLGSSNDLAILGDSLYDGKEMADRGGVIVVTVNYRVGTLGFLSTGDSRLPGNYGLWDQHAAISWVRRNIRGFGGNPDNLTIFGQSAGAASVSFQMLSPYSKGLFRRAITQCGVALSPWALQKNPMALTKKIARKVGCWRTDEDEMLTCLKMSDPVGLTMAGKIDIMLILGKGVVMDMLELSPVVDGDFIPDEPSNLFHNAARFDYLAGVNSMDGHIFAGVDVPSINSKKANTTAVALSETSYVEQHYKKVHKCCKTDFTAKAALSPESSGAVKPGPTPEESGSVCVQHSDDDPRFTWDWNSNNVFDMDTRQEDLCKLATSELDLSSQTEQVKGLLAGLTKEKGNAAIPSAFSVYSVHWGLAPDPAIVKKTVADIETDFLFLVPTQIALQLHANNSSGIHTYSYLFNMKTRIPGFPRWVEAEHAEDLQYLFGKPFSTPLVYFPRHRDLSGYMIAYWTNFAKTGDPNRGGSRVPVPWPLFTKNHRPYLIINHDMSKSSVSYDLRSYYVNYWTETYSHLPAAKTAEEDERL